jgi:MoxR-like ATPase
MTNVNASPASTPGPALRPVLIVEDEIALYAGQADPARTAELAEVLSRSLLIGGQPGSGKSCMARLLAARAALNDDGAGVTVRDVKENPDG